MSKRREDKNWKLRAKLKQLDMEDAELDALVREICDEVSAAIDCSHCANCCVHSAASMTEAEVAKLSIRLGMPPQTFIDTYLDPEMDDGMYNAKSSPCPFLESKACSLGDDRPLSCREFPVLRRPDFRSRLIGVVNNLSLCPIAFNVYAEPERRLRQLHLL